MAKTSGEILIAFGTQALDKARNAVNDVAKVLKQSLRDIKDVRQRAKAREAINKEVEALREGLAVQGRLRARGRTLADLADGSGAGAVKGNVNAAKEAFEKAKSLAGAAATGNVSGALELLSNVPVAGQIAAGAGAVIAVVLPYLERQLERKIEAASAAAEARARRALFEADVGRRFREDPAFRDAESQRAYRRFQQQAQNLSGRWRRRGRYLVRG